MSIAIIVEDGSNVPNANSYVSIADARLYALNRGVVLPVDDDSVASMLINATDYLETFACEYLGKKTSVTQPLEWPRTIKLYEGGCESTPPFGVNEIPKNLIAAQIQGAIAISEGFSLQGNINPQDYVTRETVGPITTEYADPIKVGISPKFGAIDALLAPLFGKCANNGGGFRTYRV